ncbi:sulfite exporter TauE/SafE family protein [Tenacibaculum amylolyticum]|uniref:sulfite exporter TauE/SafE family protein n=1 Tax=Tenacibaculum amylolyticum TaxID=104269 RepID=UPI0038948269
MTEYLLLILVGLIAGVINTIAGGGSLLTLPMLIFMGLPSNIANGTNRIAILIQNIFSIAGFKSKGVSAYPFSLYIGIAALLGSLVGARIAVDIKGETFNRILAIVMVVVVVLMVLKPKTSLKEVEEQLTGKYLWLSLIIFFFIGIYGGFIQAGTGLFMLLAMSSINHFSLVKANAAKVMVAFIYTIGAVVVFALNDKISWKHGLILAIGNSTGAWFASRWSVNKGDNLVKIFLAIMVIFMAIKLWFFS